jgi:ribosome-associated toxin RatA of RatAB toxin-antitoxin module
MHTRIERHVHAQPELIFELAARVEDWPRILPHYRWVRVRESGPEGRRTVEMAARRDVLPWSGLGVPVRWAAIQTLHPRERRIEFEHVRGVTRGMRVAWSIEPQLEDTLRVRIEHVFEPPWPVPPALVQLVVGEYFVNGIARRTLERICALAQAGQGTLTS